MNGGVIPMECCRKYLIEGQVLIELKSIDAVHAVHHKQVLTYLKLTGLKLGLLVNFNTDDIARSIIRKVKWIVGRISYDFQVEAYTT